MKYQIKKKKSEKDKYKAQLTQAFLLNEDVIILSYNSGLN